jgi:hypothetical protein
MKIFFACFLVVGVIAAIAYYLHGLYLLGQFDSAIATMHELIAAETNFAKAHSDRGYTCDLSQLIVVLRREMRTRVMWTFKRLG